MEAVCNARTDKGLVRTLCTELLQIIKKGHTLAGVAQWIECQKGQISDRNYVQKTNRPFTKDVQVSVLAARRVTLSNIC